MAISDLLGAGLFNEYREDLILKPLQSNYGGLGFSVRLISSAMHMSRLRQRASAGGENSDMKMMDKMALNLYYYGYMLGLGPIVLLYPTLSNRLKTMLNLLGNSSIKLGLGKVIVSIISKIQDNFLLLAIFIPILGLLNILCLIIAESIGKSIEELNEEKKKSSKISLINLVTSKEILRRYRASIRMLGHNLAKEFPMISKFFRFIYRAIEMLASALNKIKEKVSSSIEKYKSKESKPEGNLESISLGKMLGGGFIIAILVGIFKKTPIGGLIGLLVGLILTMSEKNLQFIKRLGPVYNFFIMFRTLGRSLLNRLGILEFLTKAKEFVSSLSVVQTLQTSFTNIH